MSEPSPVPPDDPSGDPPGGDPSPPPPAPPSPFIRRLWKSKTFWGLVGTAVISALTVGLTLLLGQNQGAEEQKGADEAKKKELAAKPPVLSAVSEDWEGARDPDWILDRALSPSAERKLASLPPGRQHLREFTKSVGAIEVIETCEAADRCGSRKLVRLTLTGHRMDAVEVTDIKAKILSQKPSTQEGFILGPHGGAADVEGGVIDLDSEDRRLRNVDQDGKAGTPYFAKRLVTLKTDERLAFHIEVTSLTWDYDWELVVSLVSEGEASKLTVRSDGTSTGKPFRNPGRIYKQRNYRHFYACEVGTLCRIGPGKNGYPDEIWDR
ncbi:hypothetical protein [Streptomyces hiroshimensis]|uniref:hypothetical protein n=1 Tax=Streptomyces hiroshimensis TaxID=66424 RepID=UPI00167565D7|nr:hypothetical protein [Streptomyces hiroshimensis]